MWLRILALFFDGFALIGLFTLILVPLLMTGSDIGYVAVLAVPILVGVFYTVIPTALTGKTLGKLVFGIKVIHEDNPYGVPGWGPSIIRYIVNTVLSAVSGLGTLANLIVAAVDDPEHRALHDRAAKTRVVSTRANISGGVVAIIVIVALLLGVVMIGILSAIAIPVFLNQREKGVEVQMRTDAQRVATLVIDGQQRGILKPTEFPISIPAGGREMVGGVPFAPSYGDAVTVTLLPDQSGNFCVKVMNDESANPVIFLDSRNGSISPTPCDGTTPAPATPGTTAG